MRPAEHSFRYRMFMVYLDLAELDEVFEGRWLWSTKKRAVARFKREDHFGDPERPLDQCVRDLVERETGRRPRGPVRLLTHLRYFGYVFNPVSFFYCFAPDGETLETIVAEVNNTPWGERTCYVLGEADNEGREGAKRYRPAKRMHVSPFMEMDVDYDWRFTTPDARLAVHMECAREGEKVFDATLALERTELTGGALARVLATHPLITLKVIFAIHWQALKLWLKRVPVHDHPDKKAHTAQRST